MPNNKINNLQGAYTYYIVVDRTSIIILTTPNKSMTRSQQERPRSANQTSETQRSNQTSKNKTTGQIRDGGIWGVRVEQV